MCDRGSKFAALRPNVMHHKFMCAKYSLEKDFLHMFTLKKIITSYNYIVERGDTRSFM